MAKISQKELDYIKNTISSEQLIDLVSLKAKMNKRKLKLGRKIDESHSIKESYSVNLEDTGFREFYDNFLDEREKNIFGEVFGTFQNENSTALQSVFYQLFKRFLDSADRQIIKKSE